MSVVRMTYPKLFAKMSGHFLTQELPDSWEEFDSGELEEWFVECAWEPFEHYDWEEVYFMVRNLTDEIWKIYGDDK